MSGRPVFIGPAKPGVNLDHINIDAGVGEAIDIGYASTNDQMVVEYALARWRRGEEEGALKTMMSHGIALTCAYRIVAAARIGGELAHTRREFMQELEGGS